MSQDRSTIIMRLRGMLNKLASNLGNDASGIGEDVIIPDTGMLDSASIIDFVLQIDVAYDLKIEPEDMTIDNFGSLSAIADFVTARKA